MKNNNQTRIDPVCGMKVDLNIKNGNIPGATYNGKEYYFCSLFCNAAFVVDPDKYVNSEHKNNKSDHKKSLIPLVTIYL